MDPVSTSYKWCFVPNCSSTSSKTPWKLFVTVPKGPKRARWLQAARRKERLSEKSSLYCCQDHLNLEEALENYMYVKMNWPHNWVKIQLKPDALPSKFDCQKTQPVTKTKESPKLTNTNKLSRRCVNELTLQSPFVPEINLEVDNSSFGQQIDENRPALNYPEPLECCPECPGLFKNKSRYYQHIDKCDIRRNSLTSKTCHICLKKFSNSKSLVQHKEKIHKPIQRFTCDSCDKSFLNRQSLKKHMHVHKVVVETDYESIDEVKMEELNTDTEVKVVRKRKTKAKKTQKQLQCPLCNSLYKTKTAFSKHIRMSLGRCVNWKCHTCNCMFDSEVSLTAHNERRHSETQRRRSAQSHQCPICSKSFFCLSLYNIHIREKHMAESPLRSKRAPTPPPVPKQRTLFECFYCGEKLRRRSLLINHIKSHTYLFKCPLCSLRFHNEEDREKHSVHHT